VGSFTVSKADRQTTGRLTD